MNGPMRYFIIVLLAWNAQLLGSTDPAAKLTEPVQDAVNWWRLWYGKPTDTAFLRTSSSAWAVLVEGISYVALPEVGLAVELGMDASAAWSTRVEELPTEMSGQEAVNAYIARLRREAAFESDPKANRFNVPRRPPNPVYAAVRRDEFRILELGLIALPIGEVIPTGKEERLRFVARVKSVLDTDPGLHFCEPRRAIVPQYGAGDPLIFVFVENAQEKGCGDFVVPFERREGSKSFQQPWSNQLGWYDDLIQRIRSRSGSVLTF